MQINKSTIKQKYFHYDGIIFLDEKVKNYFEELCLLKSNKLKYLVILLDDRNYSLKDKNSIKAHLDILQLDVLMLTLKPYYKNIVNRKFKDFKIFRSAIRLNWILNCLEKYNINNVYLNIKVIKDLNYDYKNNLDLFIKLKKIINNKINSLNKKNKNILNSTFLRLINFLDYKKIIKNNIYFLNKKIKKINKKFLLKNQISRVEKNIFWIGFDKDFKDIPWDKKYQSTKWSKKFKKDKLLYQDKLQYCTRCCLPETMEGINGNKAYCLPHNLVIDLLRKYNRIK